MPPPATEPTFGGATSAPPVTPASTPAPAPIAGWQLTGILLRDGQVVPGATVRAYDLASGDPLPWQGSAGEIKTDATGRFTGRLQAQSAVQVVRLVAEKEGQAWVAVFDTQGQGVGLEAPRALLQAERVLPLALRLTGASTFGAKAFEGLFKLLFRLSDARIPGLLQEAFAAAESARQEAEQRFADQPQLEARLLQGLDAQGQWREAKTLESLSKELGLGPSAQNRLRTMLATVAAEAQAFEVKAGLEPIAPSDFWLEGIQIAADGTLTFTDAQGRTQRLVLGPNRLVRPSATPTPARSSGGGGSGGGGSRFVPSTPSPQFRLLAGGRSGGAVDGNALASAVLPGPRSLAVADDGQIYFSEQQGTELRRYGPIFGLLDQAEVVAIAGPLGNSLFPVSELVCVGTGAVYVAEGRTLKEFVPASGTVTPLTNVVTADVPIQTLAYDAVHQMVYVGLSDRLYRVAVGGSVLEWVAGTRTYGVADGDGRASATFKYIRDLVVEPETGRVYLLDDTHLLRYYDPASSQVITLAGATKGEAAQDGEGSAARFAHAWGVAVESSSTLLVGDVPNLRRVDVASGVITTWQRNSLSFTAPAVEGEGDIDIDGSGRIFVADYNGNRLIEVLR